MARGCLRKAGRKENDPIATTKRPLETRRRAWNHWGSKNFSGSSTIFSYALKRSYFKTIWQLRWIFLFETTYLLTWRITFRWFLVHVQDSHQVCTLDFAASVTHGPDVECVINEPDVSVLALIAEKNVCWCSGSASTLRNLNVFDCVDSMIFGKPWFMLWEQLYFLASSRMFVFHAPDFLCSYLIKLKDKTNKVGRRRGANVCVKH